ncbi:Nmad5 family putative nucleotide modification protein [Elizabethkingia anophelis]|uniref:Nmad5 family putative nucleotide modification protein n=1 Tax=Elizabethkingia anophelis TaxID=1117645 RepID=UPI000442AFC4|nr:Nmad5 family putative nucleotide modification protein [Elizabethkingia anophelis]CDN79515.1 hypothetical protein E27107_60089 [Elizabethkingia anophelis]
MSKYISKQQSRDIAKSLTKKIAEQISQKQNEISEIISEIYLKTLPKEIINLYSTHNKYFYKCSRIRVEGNGLNDAFDLKKSVPSDGSWQVCILPDKYEVKQILKISNEIKKLESKRNNLINSIENTLNSLRTYNRIQKEFPEAAKFLPDENKSINTLAVPIEDIRKQLEAIK